MAGKYGGQSVELFLVDGYNFVAAGMQNLRYKIASALEESQAMGDSWKECLSSGMLNVELAQDGAFFDTTAGLQHAILIAEPSTIVTSSIANPTVITTVAPHELKTGDRVRIVGHTSVTPALDGDYPVIVTAATTFTIPVNVSADGVDGTVTRLGLVFPQTAVRIVVLGFATNALGSPVTCFQGTFNNSYEVLATLGSLQRANVTFVISGKAEQAVIVHELSIESADYDPEEAADVDHCTEEGARVVTILTSSVDNPSAITCDGAHGLQTGDSVLIAGHVGMTPEVNGVRAVTVTGDTTFTVPINVTVGGTGGTAMQGESNSGGAGYLEITNLVLGTSTGVTITIEDSSDHAAYSTLLSFAAVAVAGPNAQRVTVAGEVLRYLSHTLTWTGGAGGGSTCTYLVGFARER